MQPLKWIVAIVMACVAVMPASAQTSDGKVQAQQLMVQHVPIKVVATFSIIGDLARNVGGNRVDLSVLVGPDGDVHTFEPTPKESMALAQATVVLENGFHLEPWLDKLYASSGSKAQRVVITDGIESIDVDNNGHMEEDPHVWHDAENVLVMIERIRDAFVAADPANAEFYTANADKYLTEIGDLNHWIIDTFQPLTDEQRKLVTSHDTFAYFAKRYGFTIVGAAIESSSTESSDPSAKHIAALVDKIKAEGVKTVFAENTHDARMLEAVAKEAGVALAPKLYTDALGTDSSDADTYVKMMRHNALTIKDALSGTSGH